MPMNAVLISLVRIVLVTVFILYFGWLLMLSAPLGFWMELTGH